MQKNRYAKMPPAAVSQRSWPAATLERSPAWCAVDLRDGNQALPNPMTPRQKRRYFDLLKGIGLKEIEVGFPSASQDDFDFTRTLIEEGTIPDGTVISVLTQARRHLIDRTIQSLVGATEAVVHFYIATSLLHSRYVFGLDYKGVIETAVQATRQIRDGVAKLTGSKIGLEFSPEEFTDTDLNFAVEICNRVVAEWAPGPDEKVVLNLPATVERRMPNEYADMIEEFARRRDFKENTILSLHAHNDMGCAVAATMQALLAGATRVEGTLFGHGERTGNVDLVTVALNLQYMGIDTGLDFSRLMEIADTVAEITGIEPHPRHPYTGDLVFTAFSGSHQDAIHKGFARKEELTERFDGWKIPYLHIDPGTIGRRFEKFIRINSQSGKGGIAHVLQQDYNLKMPRWVQVDLAQHVQQHADQTSRELSGEEVWKLFNKVYIEHAAPIELINYWPWPTEDDPGIVKAEVHVIFGGEKRILREEGNGPISALVHALRTIEELPEFVLEDYEEETLGSTAEAEAVCFVRIKLKSTGVAKIGAGIGKNIDQAAARAVISALNSCLQV